MTATDIGAMTIIFTALCLLAIGYRFYGMWIAVRGLRLRADAITPAVSLADGADYLPTDRTVVFGHHFAAIAAAGPLLGPVLAAQFGYLPGLLWILIGCVLAGGVHDLIVLFCAVRHKGMSLAYIAYREVGTTTGIVASWTLLAFMVLALAGLSMACIGAMRDSPWSTFTVMATILIGIVMGLYMRYWRPGDVVGASILGVLLLLAAVFMGPWVASHYGHWFNTDAQALNIMIPLYGLIASILPMWLLLVPRDYISSYLKFSIVVGLAIGIVFVAPELKMPALTEFAEGGGPVVGGPVIPFIFITIGSGALSGFHAVIATTTTPKLITNEKDILFVGYGAMMLEGFVAVIALVSTCVLMPEDYFAMNATPQAFEALGMTTQNLPHFEQEIGETLVGRTGGSVSFAVGMANIFSSIPWMDSFISYWYHFAIMFEAVFILSAIDAGTRAGRYFLQDVIGSFLPKFAVRNWWPGVLLTSVIFTVTWGAFLYSGDIRGIWPLFGVANQLLAGACLLIVSVVMLRLNKIVLVWLTAIPGVFVLGMTVWAVGWLIVKQLIPQGSWLLVATGFVLLLMTVAVVVAVFRRYLGLLSLKPVYVDRYGEKVRELID